MKARTYIFMAVLSLLCSCRGEVQPEMKSETICFSTDVAYTKATSVSATLPDGAKWGVFGYLYPTKADGTQDTAAGISNWETKHAQCKPHVFYKREVTYANGKNDYEGLEYWTNNSNDKYTFFGYYPYSMPDGGPTLTISSQSGDYDAPVVKLTYPWNTVVSNKNKTYSYVSGDKSKMVDFLTARTYDISNTVSSVPMSFEHALYAIDFAVNNYNSEGSGNTITISDVKFRGRFTKEYSFPLDQGDYSRTGATSGDFMAEFSVFSGSKQVGGDSQMVYLSDAVDRYMFFIPQAVPAYKKDTNTTDANNEYAGFQVEVKYKKGTGTTTTKTLDVPANTYLAGVKYTFTLDFMGEQVVIKTITKDGWIDNEGNTNTEFN